MKVTTISIAISIAINMLLSAIHAPPQSQEQVYAAMMVNFGRGIQWPESRGKQNAFVIAVVGYEPLADELKRITESAKIGNRKVIVKPMTDNAKIAGCDMLFLPAYKAKSLQSVVSQVGSEPTLVITNKTNLATKGSNINFVLVDGKLRYEMNIKSIESRGMKISSTLKALAILVEE